MPIDTGFLRTVAPPVEAPSPYEAYKQALTMREMVDRRRQNEELRAHQRVQWQQAEEDRQRKLSLIDLLQRNPKATPEEILKADPITGMPHIKEQRLTEEAERRADAERRRGEEVQQKVDAANRVWQANLAGSLLQEKDLKKRTDLFNQYTPAMVTLGMLTPEEAAEHMGDEPTIWKVIERGLGLEGMQNYRDKIAKAAREEELRGPQLAKATAEAIEAEQKAGTRPMSPLQTAQLVPGEEREFKAFAPSYYGARNIQTPTPADEQAARREFVMLKHPPPQPSAGMTPEAEEQRKRLTAAEIAARAAAAANKPQNQAVLRAKRLALDNVEGAIKAYRKELETTGPTFLPGKGAQLGTLYRELQLQVKEMAGLGAITGPDEKILESIVTDPTGFKGNFALKTAGLLQQLEALKGIVRRGRINLEEVYGGATPEQPGAGAATTTKKREKWGRDAKGNLVMIGTQ